MSTNLVTALAGSQPDDTIAVVAQYPEGSTPDTMIAALLSTGVRSIQIRHAFHIIPMAAAILRPGTSVHGGIFSPESIQYSGVHYFVFCSNYFSVGLRFF